MGGDAYHNLGGLNLAPIPCLRGAALGEELAGGVAGIPERKLSRYATAV